MRHEMMSPLVEQQQLKPKRRLVKSGRSEDLANLVIGGISGAAVIHQIEERDDAESVKVAAASVSAIYELTKTAQRLFQVVLDQYQRTPISRGCANFIERFWFGDCIEGRDAGMSERTFRRGLIKLLEKRFLYPKTSSSYWTNLFFEGDQVLFIQEYRRRKPSALDELEADGQQRLKV